MSELLTALNNFVLDTENPERNYDLALQYQKINQTASAISFFLRTAERTDNPTLAYECLIQSANCFNLQGNRENTVRSLYKKAIQLLPKRPEAYFCLARHYEWVKNFTDCYFTCELALNFCDFNLPFLRTNIHLPVLNAKYGLLFEKAVAAWWCGKNRESRDIFLDLINNYVHEMDQSHIDSVTNNMTKIGAGNEKEVFVGFDKNNVDKLRFKFKNYEKIENNFSQTFQDLFVLSMLDGKTNGTYLEIGSSFPFFGSNSALLEKNYNWKGVGIEIKKELADQHINLRSNKVLNADALKINYQHLLSELAVDGCVDYLQLDCEPSQTTYEIMTKIPFDQFKFRVITYEHDHYIDVTKTYRQKSRDFLIARGYELVVNDVSCDGKSTFEDWWVHPSLVDPAILQVMKDCDGNIKKIYNYFYPELTQTDQSAAPTKPYAFAFNNKSHKRVFLVDDFYEDPDAVRNFALIQPFDQGGIGRGYIGSRSSKQYLFPGLKERFEEIMDHKITRWESHGQNGRFQYAYAGDPLVYHCDNQKWAAMIYLTPDAPFETGTTLFAHKKTRIRHNSHPQIMTTFRRESTFDKTYYEPVDVLGNVYNRLVIFDAGCIHSASEYFGFNKNNCRLWQMFFFD